MTDRCCPNCDAPLEYCVSCGTGFSRFEIDVPKRPDVPVPSVQGWPSVEEVAQVIQQEAGWRGFVILNALAGGLARAVLALFEAVPRRSEAQIKAQAWDEGLLYAMSPGGIGTSPNRAVLVAMQANPYRLDPTPTDASEASR